MAASFCSQTGVMSRNVVGTKPQSSGWCGSKRRSAGGAIVVKPLATPAPLASWRAWIVASDGNGMVRVERILSRVAEHYVRLDVAHDVGQLRDRGAVHL